MGGATLVMSASVYKLVSSVYPEYEWLPWRFHKTPANYWTDVKNQRKFMDWAGKELGIKDMSDWYKVTTRVVKNREYGV